MTPDSAAHYTKRMMDLPLRRLQSVIPPTALQIARWLLPCDEARALLVIQVLEGETAWGSPEAFLRMLRAPMDVELMRFTYREAEVWDGGEWIGATEHMRRTASMVETQEATTEREPRSAPIQMKRPVSRDAQIAAGVRKLCEQTTMRREKA